MQTEPDLMLSSYPDNATRHTAAAAAAAASPLPALSHAVPWIESIDMNEGRHI